MGKDIWPWLFLENSLTCIGLLSYKEVTLSLSTQWILTLIYYEGSTYSPGHVSLRMIWGPHEECSRWGPCGSIGSSHSWHTFTLGTKPFAGKIYSPDLFRKILHLRGWGLKNREVEVCLRPVMCFLNGKKKIFNSELLTQIRKHLSVIKVVP